MTKDEISYIAYLTYENYRLKELIKLAMSVTEYTEGVNTNWYIHQELEKLKENQYED